MPTLQLMRPDEKVNSLAVMEVYLNGQPLGSILNNERKEFEVPEGKHRLKAKIDSQGSNTYHFTITASAIKALVISTNKGANTPEPWMSGTMIDFIVLPLQLIYYFTIGYNSLLTIAELKRK